MLQFMRNQVTPVAALYGGPSYSAEAQQFFDRLATQPSAPRKAAYDTLITGLVYAGVWSKLDGLYILAAADAPTARTNLIQSAFGASVVGSPTFTVDQGYAGDNTGAAYLATGFDPTVGSPLFTRDNASLFAWRCTNVANDIGMIIAPLGQQSYLQTYPPDGKFYCALTGSSGDVASFGALTGLFEITRSNSTIANVYLSGVPLLTISSGSTAIPAGKPISIIGDGGTQGSNSQIAAGGFGAGLSASDSRNLTTGIQRYLTTISGGSTAGTLGFSSDVVNDGANNLTPGFARLADGRLIVVYLVGAGAPNGQQDGKLVYKLSSDNGKTWAAATDIAIPSVGNSYLDASVTVTPSGTIIISFMEEPNDFSSSTVKVIRGTVAGDLSISWGSIINVPSSNASPATTSYALPLADGRLMLGFYTWIGSTSARVVFSSDDGVSWGDETTVFTYDAIDLFNEANYVQLANGTIVGVLRNDSPTFDARKGYWVTLSTDGGDTWSVPTQIINNTVASQPGRPAIAISPNGTIFMVSRFIGPVNDLQTGYTYSEDGGVTWSAPVIYYNIGLKTYGQHVYAQGFYDAITETFMYAICQGTFNAAQINFQQFSGP